jgi:quercetin dioxygenase-like cupin family protein
MRAMSGQVCVLQTDTAGARVGEQPGAGPASGFTALEQSILWLRRGDAVRRATGADEEVLFVTRGAGTLDQRGEGHALEAESGAYLPPGEEYELSAGPDGLHLVSVRVPHPELPQDGAPRVVVRRLADQAEQNATTERSFRIVADPSTGLRSATQFVGYIPTARAPDHFHTYDEVIYVLEGEGRFHVAGAAHPVAPGTCIGLPARTIHCLENTGASVMRVMAVFRPAGSPAAAYYPDGAPAYPGVEPISKT